MATLKMVMNAAARLVILTPRDGSATAALKKLHWLPIKSRIVFKMLSITYKALIKQAPAYICDLLVPYTYSRMLRSAEKYQLHVPKCDLKYGERSFTYAAPKLWNDLPIDIKRAQSYQCFKKMLKTHLFKKAF